MDDHDRQFLSMERLWRAYCDLKADNERYKTADSILRKLAVDWVFITDESGSRSRGTIVSGCALLDDDELAYLQALNAAALVAGRNGTTDVR